MTAAPDTPLRAALTAEITARRRYWLFGAAEPHDLACTARDVARRTGHTLAEALAETASLAVALRLQVLRTSHPTKARITG